MNFQNYYYIKYYPRKNILLILIFFIICSFLLINYIPFLDSYGAGLIGSAFLIMLCYKKEVVY